MIQKNLNDVLDKVRTLYPAEIDLTLDRLLTLLSKLGNPHRRLPPVIHVAGTNGKGSTIAFCRSILEAAGYSVHVYTSPHLVVFNERIRVAGKIVDDQRLYDALSTVERINNGAPITFFEATTAAAFLLFSEIPADIVLLETGLGGRLDATNVIESSLISIITPISYDHPEYLGNTLVKIAFEKAGIIKSGTPVVIAPQPDEVIQVLLDQAALKDSLAYVCGRDWDVHLLLGFPPPNLTGAHQTLNAATAVKALTTQACLPVTADAIATGLTTADWPGRLQCLSNTIPNEFRNLDLTIRTERPEWTPGCTETYMRTRGSKIFEDQSLKGEGYNGYEVWVDGAHNVGGAKALAQHLAAWKQESPAPIVAIIGMKARKDVRSFLATLKPFIDRAVMIPIPDTDNGENYDPKSLAELAASLGILATTATNFDQAVDCIKRSYRPPCRMILTGSLYLVGHILAESVVKPG